MGLVLPPGAESFADSLIGRFGDRLAIEIAGRPYLPPGCGEMPSGGSCPTPDPTPAATAELTARLVLASHDVRQGGMLTGQLIVESHGARALAMYGSGSGLAPTVFDPARPGLVGMFNGAMTADLHAYLLQAGDVVSIPVILSGARCGGANGENSMPPGGYTVRASVGFVEPVDLSTVAMSDLLRRPVVATVTADANVHIIRA